MQNHAKVVLITGAARRVGATLCRTLHSAGMNIALHFNHSQEEARTLAYELTQVRGDSIYIFQTDLKEMRTLPDLIKDVVEEYGRLDVLINNASTFYPTSLETANLEQWDDLLATNLRAPYFLSQAAAPYLKASNGCIINIVDIHGYRALKEYSIYSIAKAGLIMLTESLAKECGPLVRVNAIAPGAVLWPEKENHLSPEKKQEIIEETALKRVGTPDDIARTALFLINDAPYITGQIIKVDGGRSLYY